MEKLSIEERAKRYDEALDRAKIWKDKSGMPKDKQYILDDIFPELKESGDERIRKEIIEYIKIGTYHKDWIAWLEKQGKKEEPQVYETENGEVITYSKNEGYKVVEPKFHEGDWLVINERKRIVKIVNRTPFDYKVVDTLGYHHTITNDAIENNYHLWTIQDAKNGDVLAAEPIEGYSSSFVAICKKRNEEDFDSYCFVGFDGYFYKDERGHSTENIHPATNEQRDTLMKAMADKGYTFDFEKKELRKIL